MATAADAYWLLGRRMLGKGNTTNFLFVMAIVIVIVIGIYGQVENK
jgi:hypothetical protein